VGPAKHTAIALGIGTAVWAGSGEPLAVPAAIAAGVLNDADHLIDYYLWFKKRDVRRLYLVLHTWELSAVGLVALAFWGHPLLLAAVLAHLGHLVGDFVANRPKSILTYSLVFRAVLGFERDRLIEPPPDTLSEALGHNIPFWRLLEPRLPGKLSRMLGLDSSQSVSATGQSSWRSRENDSFGR